MILFITLTGHAAVAYLHVLLSWRFYPQRQNNFFVNLFWYLMVLSLALHTIYSIFYLALLLELMQFLKPLQISGYLLLAFYPAILATLFLGELTEKPKKSNAMANLLSLISRDSKKLFLFCVLVSALTILPSIITEITGGNPVYNFGNFYALTYMVLFGGVWLLMFLSGLRAVSKKYPLRHPTFGIVIAVIVALSFGSIYVNLGHAWSLVPIVSTTGISLCFCWYRFRTQLMDVIVNQFVRILMLLAIVVGLYRLTSGMNDEQLNGDVQMLCLLLYVLVGSLLFAWINKLSTSWWHPPLAMLSKVHTELPSILNRCTDEKNAIEKTELYLAQIFSTQVRINQYMTNSVHTLVLEGKPHIEINLGYMRRWMPWFSEALNWVRTAGLYLQSHLKVLQTLEKDHQQQLKAESLSALAAKAEMIAMRSQIRPHFLFNILNSIHSFVSTDPKQAEHTIEILAELMRGVLQMSDKDEVTLQQELCLVKKYLSIEKIRYGEQFQFQINCDEECLSQSLPSFSIQPLVENAFKYAVDTQFEPVVIVVIAKIENHFLKIKVIDDGPGISKTPSSGMGMALQNIESRIKNLYGARGELTLVNGDSKGAIASLQIPIKN